MNTEQPFCSPRIASRRRIYLLNRSVIGAVLVASFGSWVWQPASYFAYVADVVLRTYLMFLGTVMAHEGTHGHLGRSKSANFWWGTIALLPCLVPFTNFRKTHRLHHAFTNVPDKDPDYYLNAPGFLRKCIRILSMPHSWFFWLRKRGLMRKQDTLELAANYAGIWIVYLPLLLLVGPIRLVTGLAPALILLSFLLWYPFAIKTHEGYSTGTPESRSHDYYGRFLYWFSLGLSMHRVHHMQPSLAWIELKQHVQRNRRKSWRALLPIRDIRRDPTTVTS